MTNYPAVRMAILASVAVLFSACATSRHMAFVERDFERANGPDLEPAAAPEGSALPLRSVE